MSVRRLAGGAILSLPFVVIFGLCAADTGLLGAVLVLATTAAIFGCIAVGVWLWDGDR